ncbi:uncharacterized protein EHS24_004766 [Apiotrichum porosum]|uniref:Chromosome segregation in meiosis protein n=1 Tax=Apiotrichum porosum TaxID=105984 RepID=A0A427Y610_9TREE|nr:uncharacterized protein EHS24_004766 [Apiotrichum porosum]RSH86506.1 hypothetical protein EHS24_004766 [Apiotrichum porosum]
MATSLADLFSDNSPPRPVPRARSVTPTSPGGAGGGQRRANHNPLFLSPSASVYSPQRPRRTRYGDDDDDNEDGGNEYDLGLRRSRSASPSRHASGSGSGSGAGRSRPGPRTRSPSPTLDPLNLAALAERAGSDVRIDPRAALRSLDDPFSVQDPFGLGGGTGVMVDGGGGVGVGDEPGTKVRIPRAKVDAERLLGPKGMPALMGVAKKWKPRGKGHEVKDLNRLLDVYQMWAHSMFPRGEFLQTMQRVETVCRTRRMMSAIHGLRDAFEGNDRPRTVDDLDPEDRIMDDHYATNNYDDNLDLDEDDEAALAAAEADAYANANGNGNDTHASASRQALFDPAPDADEPDWDEMAAMEEMEREAAGAADAPPPAPAAAADAPPVLEEDPWEGLYD